MGSGVATGWGAREAIVGGGRTGRRAGLGDPSGGEIATAPSSVVASDGGVVLVGGALRDRMVARLENGFAIRGVISEDRRDRFAPLLAPSRSVIRTQIRDRYPFRRRPAINISPHGRDLRTRLIGWGVSISWPIFDRATALAAKGMIRGLGISRTSRSSFRDGPSMSFSEARTEDFDSSRSFWQSRSSAYQCE